jgi:hypothetical protein
MAILIALRACAIRLSVPQLLLLCLRAMATRASGQRPPPGMDTHNDLAGLQEHNAAARHSKPASATHGGLYLSHALGATHCELPVRLQAVLESWVSVQD